MSRPAVFLDRDGTLIEECHYLTCPEQVRLLPGIGPALARLRRAGFACVVVTNQSAVGRGMMTETGLGRVHEEFFRQLHADGGALDGLYYCPADPRVAGDDPERKPAPGMLLRAARDLNLDLADSWMVGDTSSDVGAGRNAGCRGSFLVRTGHALADESLASDRCRVVADVVEAAACILADALRRRAG